MTILNFIYLFIFVRRQFDRIRIMANVSFKFAYARLYVPKSIIYRPYTIFTARLPR